MATVSLEVRSLPPPRLPPLSLPPLSLRRPPSSPLLRWWPLVRSIAAVPTEPRATEVFMGALPLAGLMAAAPFADLMAPLPLADLMVALPFAGLRATPTSAAERDGHRSRKRERAAVRSGLPPRAEFLTACFSRTCCQRHDEVVQPAPVAGRHWTPPSALRAVLDAGLWAPRSDEDPHHRGAGRSFAAVAGSFRWHGRKRDSDGLAEPPLMHHRSDALRQQAATTTIREVPEALYLAVLAEWRGWFEGSIGGPGQQKKPRTGRG